MTPKEKRTVGERTAQTFGQVINKRPSIPKI